MSGASPFRVLGVSFRGRGIVSVSNEEVWKRSPLETVAGFQANKTALTFHYR